MALKPLGTNITFESEQLAYLKFRTCVETFSNLLKWSWSIGLYCKIEYVALVIITGTDILGLLLLTWIDCNPSMDKASCAQESVELNYL